MQTKYKRLMIGVAALGAIDISVVIALIVKPELIERGIPALVGIQLLGFIVIATIVVTSRGEYVSPKEADSEPRGTLKQWVPWFFGFIALLSFIRVILALLYIAGEQGHRHSWFSPIAGGVMGTFFLWIAIKTRPSHSKAEPNSNANVPNLGQ